MHSAQHIVQRSVQLASVGHGGVFLVAVIPAKEKYLAKSGKIFWYNIRVLKILGPWILRPKCGKESEHRWSHSISSIFVPSSLYISRESVKYVYSILKLLETKGHCDFWRECPPMVVARRNLETCGALVCSVCSVCAVCPLCNAATWICNSHIFCEGPASAVWPP